jgi:hypothetical protein
MKKKIRNSGLFLVGLNDLSIYLSKSEKKIELVLKARIDFEEKAKLILLHTIGPSQQIALRNALVKLTAKYGKLCRRYTPVKQQDSLSMAV